MRFVLDNVLRFTEECVGLPVMMDDKPIGVVAQVSDAEIECFIFPRFVTYYPEFIDMKPSNLTIDLRS